MSPCRPEPSVLQLRSSQTPRRALAVRSDQEQKEEKGAITHPAILYLAVVTESVSDLCRRWIVAGENPVNAE